MFRDQSSQRAMKEKTLRSAMFAYFNNLSARYSPDTVERVGWSSRSTQVTRFDILTNIGPLQGRSILDVGCGVGDFYGYLKEKNIEVDYIGYDLIPENCRAATEKYGKELFFDKDILDTTERKQFDYVVASGIFFLPADNWEDAVTAILKRMFDLCRIGIATNFLSSHSPRKVPTSFYVDPAIVINICSQMTTVFNLRHDYAAKRNDFTMFAYREINSTDFLRVVETKG